MRPERVVLVCGTGTDVGKTWTAARLAEALRGRGVRVAARKPAQSFEPGDDDDAATDAHALAAATDDLPESVCPPHRWYEVPMAPPMAAEALGRTAASLAELAAELRWPDDVGVGLVETAGGVRSPLGADAEGGDAVALADILEPDLVVLVADAGLGTINAVRLSVEALAAHHVVVLLNRFDAMVDLHRRNRSWLSRVDRFDVITSLAELAARLAPSDGGPMVPIGHADKVEQVVARAAAWAAGRPDVRALALVGSWARGTPTVASDVDLVLLTDDVDAYTSGDALVRGLGPADIVRTRGWGAITERRLALRSGLEVEVGVGEASWASTEPVDEGTRRVARDGLRVLYDPEGLLALLVIACA